MRRRPPRSTPLYSSAASDVYKRQGHDGWGRRHISLVRETIRFGAWRMGGPSTDRPFSRVSLWPRFLSAPNQWLTDQEKLQQVAMARVRAGQPLPMLDGTVDVIPSIQSAVIANGLKY